MTATGGGVCYRLAMLCLLALSICSGSAEETEWVDLFDGRSLAGWTYVGTPGAATIDEGALRLQSTGPGKQAGHLLFVGPDPSQPRRFENFELEVVSRGREPSNSGVFVHTTPAVRNKWGHLADGYEVQLNNVPEEKNKTGSLYAIEQVAASPVDESDWFVMRVVVRGDTIEVFVQPLDGAAGQGGDDQVGEPLVRYTEPPDAKSQRPKNRKGRVLRPGGGLIALQAHDPGSVWWFRSVRVRELD